MSLIKSDSKVSKIFVFKKCIIILKWSLSFVRPTFITPAWQVLSKKKLHHQSFIFFSNICFLLNRKKIIMSSLYPLTMILSWTQLWFEENYYNFFLNVSAKYEVISLLNRTLLNYLANLGIWLLMSSAKVFLFFESSFSLYVEEFNQADDSSWFSFLIFIHILQEENRS